MGCYNISRYIVDLCDFPEALIWDRFDKFKSCESEPQIRFRISSDPIDSLNIIPDEAEQLVDHPIYMTYRYNDSMHFFGTPYDIISYTRASNDYSDCLMNISPEYYNQLSDAGMCEHICGDVMMNMRKMLTGKLALDTGFIMHSYVIGYKGYGILFSAASGTGKSTHAHFWQEVFPETEMINGDNGFCRILDGCPYVFGTPWCGDSNEYTNKSVPIKAIIFIEQAEENKIVGLDEAEAFIRLSARCYMPFWDEVLISKTMNTVELVTQAVDCYHLRCLPDRDAVKVVESELFRV